MKKALLLGLVVVLAGLLAACSLLEALEPPPDREEAQQTSAARLATNDAGETAAAATLAAEATAEAEASNVGRVVGEGATVTPTLTATPTPMPTATPSPSATPPPTPTPDLTAEARSAACGGDIFALVVCVNDMVIPLVFEDGLADHRIVNNLDPTPLYGPNAAIMALLTGDGVTLVHNLYTRPENCPLGTACILHLLMIEFASEEDALAFLELASQIGDPDNETVFEPPNAEDWDGAKCATTSRPATTPGAPDFAVIYCSVSDGVLHWGFNLSSYDTLPEDFEETVLDVLMAQVHDYLSVWQ